MTIPNTIQKLTYKNITYEAKDTNGILCLMNENLSMEKLGELFGCTRSAIQYRIAKNCNQSNIRESKRHHLDYRNRQIVEDLQLGLSDEETAIRHNISPQVVRKLRTKSLPMTIKQKITNLSERRKRLCYSLFGYDYLPDSEFVPFIDKTISYLQNWEMLLIREYYILGQVSIHKQAPNRSHAKSKLRDKILSLFTIGKLVEGKVICKK